MELKIYFDSKYLLLSDSKSTNNSIQNIQCVTANDAKKCIKQLERSDIAGIHLYSDSFEDLLTIVKSEFLYLEAAGGAVCNFENKILCMFRRGFWDLPKGKLDKGETPQQAAVREVIEETGVEGIKLGKYICSTWHTYEHPKGKGPVLKQTYWYSMRTESNTKLIPQTEEDIEKVLWLNNDEITKTVIPNTFPSIIDVLNTLK